MALIKCPECGNQISDKAESCPKCGYELNKKETPTTSDNKVASSFMNKVNIKYILIILAIIVAGFLFFYQNNNNTGTGTGGTGTGGTGTGGTGTGQPTTPSTDYGYTVYNDPYLGISFEMPGTYKVATDKEGYIYVGRNIDSQGALIPYIIIGRYDKYTSEVQFLNDFTTYMKKQYSDLKVTIDLLSGTIGNKTVYGLAYNYTSSGHLVVDNRYAILVNGKVYMVGSKEENTNSTEINNVVTHILSTLTERGS